MLDGTIFPPWVVWSSNGIVDVDEPVQIVPRVIAAIDGFGLTVIVTVNVEPTQLPDVGVTV
jgi:hypothetical protein